MQTGGLAILKLHYFTEGHGIFATSDDVACAVLTKNVAAKCSKLSFGADWGVASLAEET